MFKELCLQKTKKSLQKKGQFSLIAEKKYMVISLSVLLQTILKFVYLWDDGFTKDKYFVLMKSSEYFCN